jgi:class 3 adenylate cyclase
MSMLSDLNTQIDGYMAGQYKVTAKSGVPIPEDIPLGNEAAELNAATLFVDVRQSSDITNTFRRQTAAKIMKAYFVGAVKIVNTNNGYVRSFNGDGMLAIFVGEDRHDHAVKAAMQLKWFVNYVLEPKFRQYFNNNLKALGSALNFSIGSGIDEGTIYAVRVGIKGTNDVAWIGRCTNTSAKLSGVTDAIAITGAVYNNLSASLTHAGDARFMWEQPFNLELGGVLRTVRATNFHWTIV